MLFLRLKKIELRIFYVCLVSPFIIIIHFLSEEALLEKKFAWGFFANKDMFDPFIMGQINLICIFVVLGFVSLSIKSLNFKLSAIQTRNSLIKNQELIIGSIYLFIGFFLLYLSAPSSTIFEISYREIVKQSSFGGVDSLWSISLVFILIGAVVLYQYKNSLRFEIFIFIMIFISYFHFFRGNRELLPFFTFLFIFLYSKEFQNFSKPLILMIFIIVLISTSLFNEIRFIENLSFNELSLLISKLTSMEISLIINKVLSGTWAASSLTILSVITVLNTENSELLYGQDYLDLILSTPPQFISDLIGYQRPWTRGDAPENQMIYGIGGINIIAMVLRNFGFTGVFILGLLLRFIAELIASLKGSNNILCVTFYLAILSIVPYWFWYGDKILINTVVTYAISIIPIYFLGLQNKCVE